MEQIDYKKKYEESLERAEGLYNCHAPFEQRVWIEDIFPELKESEDERIRKCFLSHFSRYQEDEIFLNGITIKQIVAWFEKQGEYANFRNKIQIGDKVTRNEDGVLVNLSQLNRIAEPAEKQGKQKSIDKVEAKFKVGDWIVDTRTDKILQIQSVNSDGYDCSNGDYFNNSASDNYRLWTIKDAKDGDVLSFNDGHGNDSIELIKSITDKKIEFWFCLTNSNRYEVFDGVVPYTNFASREDATPATKEQRDLLFQKMKEAGYEWDVEKKELKKIEQKFDWSEEDKKEWNHLIGMLEGWLNTFRETIYKNDCNKAISWLKSLKERVQPQPKQEWNEEDEERLNSIIESYKYLLRDYKACHDVDYIPYSSDTVIRNVVDDVKFLKSLKERYTWKPSNEQMEALWDSIPENVKEISEREILLNSLYQDLKKLREE